MPLLWVSLGFAGGILLCAGLAQAGLHFPALVWAGLACAPALGGLLLRQYLPGAGWLFRRLPRLAAPPALLAAAVFLGAARLQAAQPSFPEDHIARLTGSTLVVHGWVCSPLEPVDQSAQLRLCVTHAAPAVGAGAGLQPARGVVLVRAQPGTGLAYGDFIQAVGRLQQPPEWEDFSYRDYLERQGVYAWMPHASLEELGSGAGSPILAAVYRLRQRLYASLRGLFPAPESELLAGILLGIEGGIPASLSEAFKVTGTAHIIAISGFNMAVLAALLSRLFNRLAGYRRGLLLTVAGLAFYTILAGAGASVIRAAVMGCIGLYGRSLGRRQAGANSLAFTAALMAAFNPLWLWDVGFQLSFSATLGLVLYAGPLEAWTLRILQSRLQADRARRAAGLLAEYFLLTLAAQVTTLPVMAYHFGRLSLSAFLVNPLVLPVQPAVMIAGGLAALASLFSQALAHIMALPAWAFLAFTIRMVELWARLPGASFYAPQGALWAAGLYYAGLLCLTTLRSRLAALKPYWRPSLALLILAALTVAVWRQALTRQPGRLIVEVLAGGETNAVLVHTPSGRSLLAGGGGSQAGLAAEVGRRLPLWGSRLDGILVARPDGLAQSMEQYQPAWALWLVDDPPGSGQQELEAALAGGQVRQANAAVGQVLELGGGARLEIVPAGKVAPVLRLTWKKFRLWLVGGEAQASQRVVVPTSDLVVRLDGQVEEGSGLRIIQPPAGGWLRMVTDGERLWVEQGL